MAVVALAIVALVVGAVAYAIESKKLELGHALFAGSVALVIANFVLVGTVMVVTSDQVDLLLPVVAVFLGGHDTHPLVAAIVVGISVVAGLALGERAKSP